MFTGNEDMEATALREQGWSISAIARHLGRDRETVRSHLSGTRVAGERRRVGARRVRARSCRICASAWARTRTSGRAPCYDEVVALGFDPLATRASPEGSARHELRPHCEACAGVKGRATIEIEHPPGEEIQWDWDELPEAPWGRTPTCCVGSLPVLGQVPGRLRRVRGPGPPDRGHRRRAAAPRRQRPALALRPHGDRRRPEDRHRPTELRPRRQALRRECRRLPAPAGQPQGLGREVHPLRHPALLAHDDGTPRWPGPRASSTGSARHRRPTAPADRQARGGARERTGAGMFPGGGRRQPTVATWPSSRASGRFRRPATRRRSRTTTRVGPPPWSPSRAMPTRCLRADRRRGGDVRHRLGTPASRSLVDGRYCSPATPRDPRRRLRRA